MKMRHFLTVNALANLGFAAAFLVAPDLLLSLFAVTLNPGSALIARLFGAAILGFTLIPWSMRDADPADRQVHALLVAFFVADLAGTVAFAQAMLAGAVNALGWAIVAMYVAYTAAFGYYAFRRPAAADRLAASR